MSLQFLFRRLLRWQTEALTVPMCMSDFQSLVSKGSSPYVGSEIRQIAFGEVKVELISLPKIAPNIIPLLSLLPKDIASKYSSEENILSKSKEDWDKMKGFKVRLGMAVTEYEKVVNILLKLKMVKLLSASQVKVINGLQCVSKTDGRQRLIFDGRPVNFIFDNPEKVFLPDFALLADWEVEKNEVARFGKLDLDNFYHRLGVPAWMTPYLALPGLKWGASKKESGVVYPACLTLPMGLAHAVFLAQHAHLSLFRHSDLFSRINARVFSSTALWVLIYIDDLIVGVKEQTEVGAISKVNSVLKHCLNIYEKCKLVVNADKVVLATSETIGLGCCISATRNGIFPREKKVRKVVGATRYLLHCEVTNSKQVESILGHWVWFFLLCRPLYSLFFSVYRWLKRDTEDTNRPLWVSVEREFRLAILFLDRCFLSWGRKFSSSLVATDASLKGAGACEAIMDVTPASSWINKEQRVDALGSAVWIPILNRTWFFQEHINVLEFRALLLALQPWLKDISKVQKKWRLLMDSKVVVSVINKGRSSSYSLDCLMRRVLFMCLCMNVSFSTSWFASEENPADVLSRVFCPRNPE